MAEENVDVIFPPASDLPLSFFAVAGKYFKRWDKDNREFVSNIREEYPDD